MAGLKIKRHETVAVQLPDHLVGGFGNPELEDRITVELHRDLADVAQVFFAETGKRIDFGSFDVELQHVDLAVTEKLTQGDAVHVNAADLGGLVFALSRERQDAAPFPVRASRSVIGPDSSVTAQLRTVS